MTQPLRDRLQWLENSHNLHLLTQIGRGIEKESLRVDANGGLSDVLDPSAPLAGRRARRPAGGTWAVIADKDRNWADLAARDDLG